MVLLTYFLKAVLMELWTVYLLVQKLVPTMDATKGSQKVERMKFYKIATTGIQKFEKIEF